MRNPNGFGSVYKLSGARRRPWAARKTTGRDHKGFQTYTFIGYYETKTEAMNALAAFNLKPSDRRCTFSDIYEKYIAEAEHQLRKKTLISYRGAYGRYMQPLYKMKMADIKLFDLQNLVNPLTKPTAQVVRRVLSGVFQYAARHELITPDKADLPKYLQFSEKVDYNIERKLYTDTEIHNETDPIILILLYTGLRIGELLDLKAEDVHLEDRYLKVTQSKTKAGVRIVPIAEKIVPLMGTVPITITYSSVYGRIKLRGHTPHDTRHTFISKLADLGVDERIIRAIVGHAGSGVTESVYTHIDLKPMLDAVNRL